MRFLFITQRYLPEMGAQPVRLSSVVRTLLQKGHDVDILTALPHHPYEKVYPEYRGNWYVEESRDGASLYRVWTYPAIGGGVKRISNYLSFVASGILGLSKVPRPDIVFVETPPIFAGLIGAVARRRFPEARFVLNVADVWPDTIKEYGVITNDRIIHWADRLARWIYRDADAITAVTKGVRRTLSTEKDVPEEKMLFLPNGVDTMLFDPSYEAPKVARELGVQDKHVFVYAGTLGFAHATQVIVQALAHIERQRDDIAVILIGGGSEKERVQKEADELELENVQFLDSAPLSYVADLYSFATGGLVTVREMELSEEVRPAKMFPIMGAGLPVLYSGSGEGARIVEDEHAGRVTTPEDADALAEAMMEMADYPQKAKELGQNARSFVEANLSWDALIEDWLAQLVKHEGR